VQVHYDEGAGAARLAVILAGESPASRGVQSLLQSYPATGLTRWKPGSKSPRWPRGWSDPYWGASNLAGRSKCVNQVAPKVIARVKRIAGALGVPSRSTLGEGHADIVALELSMIGVPGVVEDGMPGGNVQRKARNRSRVA
jgi:hypothetical protein